jgi:hypothetical protein
MEIRIQAGQNCPQNRKQGRNFRFEEFSVGLRLLLGPKCLCRGSRKHITVLDNGLDPD